MASHDTIVVGSGISGLTMACLLGMEGRKVLLLEKGPRLGGSMARFSMRGVAFDTGFHFTGGFAGNLVLHDMLTVLGIRDQIRPIFLPPERATRFVFEDAGVSYDLPTGIGALAERLREYFPSEAAAIDRYFQMVNDVVRRTQSMDLRTPMLDPVLLNEDMVSLEDVLGGLTSHSHLKTILSAWCMCHGTRPSEVSFANHARVSQALYESIARVEGGGEAFVSAIQKKLDDYGVEVRCLTELESLEEIRDKRVQRFVLNTGETIETADCIFTIHPQEILKLLPDQALPRALVRRVQSFEPSNGFFSVYGVMEPVESAGATDDMMISLVPTADVNRLLDPDWTGDGGMVILRHTEKSPGAAAHRVVNTFEASFPRQVAQWGQSTVGRRSAAYGDYKRAKTARIAERIRAACPPEEGELQIYDSASMLTFRDYLNSPDGSAYGIKQKLGQHNLFGRLPLRNLFVAGQSAVLPGMVGAMMSSFILWRYFVTPERYRQVVSQRLPA